MYNTLLPKGAKKEYKNTSSTEKDFMTLLAGLLFISGKVVGLSRIGVLGDSKSIFTSIPYPELVLLRFSEVILKLPPLSLRRLLLLLPSGVGSWQSGIARVSDLENKRQPCERENRVL